MLSDKQLELLKNCKTKEELIKVIKENKIELSEAELNIVNGGGLGSGDNQIEGGWKDVIKTIVTNCE